MPTPRAGRPFQQSLGFEKLEDRRLLATLHVTTFADFIDHNDEHLTLREAITRSNRNLQDDEIVLQAGTYELTLAGAGENNAWTGDLDYHERPDVDWRRPFANDTRCRYGRDHD